MKNNTDVLQVKTEINTTYLCHLCHTSALSLLNKSSALVNTVSYISTLERDPCSEDSRITYMDKASSKVVSSSTRLNNEFPKTAFTAEQLTLN